MKPFAEVFRVADSGLGLLGREPAVCIGAFPIAAHLERPAQKNGEERRPPSRLTHISGAEAQGAVALRGQEWMYPPSPEPWWVGLSPTSHFRFLQGRLAYPPVQGIPSRHLGSDTSTVRSDGGGPAVETNTAQAAAATPPPRPPLS